MNTITRPDIETVLDELLERGYVRSERLGRWGCEVWTLDCLAMGIAVVVEGEAVTEIALTDAVGGPVYELKTSGLTERALWALLGQVEDEASGVDEPERMRQDGSVMGR